MQFFLVYIREAHALDSPLPMEFGMIEDPVTLLERQALAQQTCANLDLPLPTLVDTLDDTVGLSYSGWPERLFVIGTDGKLTYVGGPGPFGFDPDSWEQAITEVR